MGKKARRFFLGSPFMSLAGASIVIIVVYLASIRFLPESLHGLANGVVGGLIASLASYAFVQKFILQKETGGIKKWLNFGPANIRIFPTYVKSEDDPRYPDYYLVPTFDARATGFLTAAVRKAGYHYPNRKIMGSHRITQDNHDQLINNIITICLPFRNPCTRVFLGLLHERYVEGHVDKTSTNVNKYLLDVNCDRPYLGLGRDDQGGALPTWKMMDFQTQNWLSPSIEQHPGQNINIQGRKNQDFAMIINARNPLNEMARVIVVCGLHGVGTFGASIYIYEQAEQLFRAFGDEDQIHLLRVLYASPPDSDNYVDAVILQVKPLWSSNLSKIQFEQFQKSSLVTN